jgi:3-dehydroquinate synthase
VNLPAGKNQVGCFYQPKMVLCDPDLLQTLPEREFRCGCAEVIKYAILSDADFFQKLKAVPIREQLEQVIESCVTIKRDYVERDEFDRGSRRLLNLGHSIGHAIEACSGYEVSHGEAVAAGMAMITCAAAERGICSEETRDALLALLKQYDLPTGTTTSAALLYEVMLSDKKRDGKQIRLVVPEAIGRCREMSVPVEELPFWLRQGGAR